MMENSSTEDFTSELKILRVIVYKHRHTHRRSDHLHGLHRLQKWSEKFLQCPNERNLENVRRCAVTCSCKLGGLIAHGHFLNYSLMSLAMIARLVTRAERMVVKGKGTSVIGAASRVAQEDSDCGEALQRPCEGAEDEGDENMDFGEVIARRTVDTSSDEEDVGEVVMRCEEERKEKEPTQPCGFEMRGNSSESEEEEKRKDVKSGFEIRGDSEREEEKRKDMKSKPSGFEIRGDSESEEEKRKDVKSKASGFEIRGDSEREEEKRKDTKSKPSGCEIRGDSESEEEKRKDMKSKASGFEIRGDSESLPAEVMPKRVVTAPRTQMDSTGEARARRPQESNKKRRKRRKC